jgi:DNA-binding NarL/FixJ family response regulator
MKTVIIIEDDSLMSDLMKEQINQLEGYHCKYCFSNPVDFFKISETPDIILLDIVMPEMNGIDAIDKILNKNPDVSIIINSIKDDSDTIFKALQKGAVGYIDKQSFDQNIGEVFSCIEKGGAYMTPRIARKVMDFFQGKKKIYKALSEREIDIVNAVLEGLSYKLIADKLYISIDTVRTHIKSIYKKLKINSKSELFKIFR